MNSYFFIFGLNLTLGIALTYSLLIASLVSVLIPRTRYLWAVFLLAASAMGLQSNILEPIALPFILCMGFASYWVTRKQAPKWARLVAGAIVTLLTFAFGFHVVPGFNNPTVIESLLVGEACCDISARLNFDKAVSAIMLIAFIVNLTPNIKKNKQDYTAALYAYLAVSIGTFSIALALNLIDYDPKFITAFIGWGIINFFFTCMAEESFFRGFFQHYLGESLKNKKYGVQITLACSSLFFGLVHFGSVTYFVFASLMGFAYAYVYYKTNKIALAITAHFLINSVHFLLFTYPAAPSALQ